MFDWHTFSACEWFLATKNIHLHIRSLNNTFFRPSFNERNWVEGCKLELWRAGSKSIYFTRYLLGIFLNCPSCRDSQALYNNSSSDMDVTICLIYPLPQGILSSPTQALPSGTDRWILDSTETQEPFASQGFLLCAAATYPLPCFQLSNDLGHLCFPFNPLCLSPC